MITRTSEPTSRHSASSHGAHVARSAGVGALPGGAHRTAAATRVSLSANPSAASTHTDWLARPARCSAANRKSPDRSPVNTRPVRLPPCAAGANPTIITRGRDAPQPGIGRPQYGSSANDLRLTTATSSRHSTSRGHARHTDTSASSCVDGSDRRRHRRRPAPASRPPRSADVAGSPGQPEPGGTGESNISPVRGWASFTRTTVHARQNRVAERARPLLDSAAITHDQRQARPAVPDSVRRADGRCGKRHLDRRVPLACAAAQRLCAGRVDRGDGGHPAAARRHLDRRRRGGLPRPQAGFDDLRRAVRVVGGRRPGARADVRGARHQRRRAGRRWPRSARSSTRQG